MSMYRETLGVLIGRTRAFRPDISSLQVKDWINDKIREVIDSREVWADLLSYTVLSSPNAYQTGTVNTNPASPIVTGTGTAWPVSDVINGFLPQGVPRTGYCEVQADSTSMPKIAVDTLLYVDAGGPQPETVAVVEVTPTSFVAQFQFLHGFNATITCSSLAGLQFRIGNSFPAFTVLSVTSPTSLTLDAQWGGAPLTANTYMIFKMYFVIDPLFKAFRPIRDVQRGGSFIETNVSQAELNFIDPQRATVGSGPPIKLADYIPSPGGSMRYELWPAQTVQYQIPVLYTKKWPDLIRDTDRPPPFINPSTFVYGAIAEALRLKKANRDPFHNPALARDYDAKFEYLRQLAINDNESKAITALEASYMMLYGQPGGSQYWQSHDWDVNAWSI